ncbi:hypothetical protein AKO1_013545 [Acrasis kona]|uniref:RGS domain-containing protein n=1 Tax=Acrasis kona TaxID=1008807 RepID=A0AAW2ZI98_9EUKA
MQSVHLESVFECHRMYEDFLDHLEDTHSTSPLLFLVEVRRLFKDNSHELITSILNKFIKEDSEFEIDLMEDERNKLVNAVCKNTPSEYMLLLKRIYNSVYIELSTDDFGLYLNSKRFNVLCKALGTEHLDQLSKPATIKEKLNSFNEAQITSQDIGFALQMSESTHQWKLVSNKSPMKKKRKDYYTYATTHNICVNNLYSLPMFKSSGYLDCSAEVALYALIDDEFSSRIYLPPITTVNKRIAYERTEKDYSQIVAYVEFKIPFAKTRHSIGMGTLAYDENRKCYIWIIKSTDGLPAELEIHRVTKKTVGTTTLAAFLIYPMSERRCRFVSMIYNDAKLSKPVQSLSALALKDYGKQLHFKWSKYIRIRGRKGPVFGGFEDALQDNREKYGTKMSWPSNLPLAL